MSIGQNYEGNMTPIRSESSTFSRGTIHSRESKPQCLPHTREINVEYAGAGRSSAERRCGDTSGQRDRVRPCGSGSDDEKISITEHNVARGTPDVDARSLQQGAERGRAWDQDFMLDAGPECRTSSAGHQHLRWTNSIVGRLPQLSASQVWHWLRELLRRSPSISQQVSSFGFTSAIDRCSRILLPSIN